MSLPTIMPVKNGSVIEPVAKRVGLSDPKTYPGIKINIEPTEKLNALIGYNEDNPRRFITAYAYATDTGVKVDPALYVCDMFSQDSNGINYECEDHHVITLSEEECGELKDALNELTTRMIEASLEDTIGYAQERLQERLGSSGVTVERPEYIPMPEQQPEDDCGFSALQRVMHNVQQVPDDKKEELFRLIADKGLQEVLDFGVENGLFSRLQSYTLYDGIVMWEDLEGSNCKEDPVKYSVLLEHMGVDVEEFWAWRLEYDAAREGEDTPWTL